MRSYRPLQVHLPSKPPRNNLITACSTAFARAFAAHDCTARQANKWSSELSAYP